MSISIFSNLDDDNNVILDPSFSDCSGAIALQALRQLDTDNQDNETPDIEGRSSGNNISFLTYTYNDYAMRRKAEVLKYKQNKLKTSSKTSFAKVAKQGGTFRRISNRRIENYIETDQCIDGTETLSKATSAGVFGDDTILYLDSSIPYFSTI